MGKAQGSSSEPVTNKVVIESKKGTSQYAIASIALVSIFGLFSLVIYNWPQKHSLPIIATPILEKPTVIAKEEVMSYWVEVVTKEGKSLRKAQDISLNSGEQIQLHFRSKEAGYLYILMPGTDNKLTTILTTKPIPATGVTTNLLKEDTEYIFPNSDQLITIGKSASQNSISIIFSLTPIKSVPFLDKAAGYSLSTEEQKAFLQIRDKAIKPNITETRGDEPYAIVNIDKKLNEDKYLAFDIDIKHK